MVYGSNGGGKVALGNVRFACVIRYYFKISGQCFEIDAVLPRGIFISFASGAKNHDLLRS